MYIKNGEKKKNIAYGRRLFLIPDLVNELLTKSQTVREFPITFHAVWLLVNNSLTKSGIRGVSSERSNSHKAPC